MFESYDDITIIPYSIDIPYFQEKYVFIVMAKPENDIKKRSVFSSILPPKRGLKSSQKSIKSGPWRDFGPKWPPRELQTLTLIKFWAI